MVPAKKMLFSGTFPANKVLFSGTFPANKVLFAGTVPANNYILLIMFADWSEIPEKNINQTF